MSVQLEILTGQNYAAPKENVFSDGIEAKDLSLEEQKFYRQEFEGKPSATVIIGTNPDHPEMYRMVYANDAFYSLKSDHLKVISTELELPCIKAEAGLLTEVITPDGYCYECTVSSIQGLVEEIYAKVTIGDITKDKKIAEQAGRIAELEAQLGQLQAKIQGLTNFALGHDHDLKNKVTGAYGYTQLLLRRHSSEPLAEKDMSTLTSIYNSLKNIKGMVTSFPHQLETFDELKKEPVEIVGFLRELQILHRLRMEDFCVEFNSSVKSQVLMADPRALDSIFTNVVQNAAEAMADCLVRSLAICCSTTADNVYITIEDTGPGVPDKVSKTLFDLHVTTKTDGNGIGLHDVINKLEGHRGEIRLCKNVTKENLEAHPELMHTGATFEIRIPIRERQYSS